VKKKKRTDERVCWVQREAAIVTIQVCNPYTFPLFVEVVGIEACVEDGSCDVPLELNSSRGFELPPSPGRQSSVVSIDLSVTPAVPGVISIKVLNFEVSFDLQLFHVPSRVSGRAAATSFRCTVLMRRVPGSQTLFQNRPNPAYRRRFRHLLVLSMSPRYSRVFL
jgi:hypothetical protein